MPPAGVAVDFAMGSAREYNVCELGSWDRVSDDIWSTHDPLASGQTLWWDRSDGRYSDDTGHPIYFAGTNPHQRGHPLRDEESKVGTPEVQWELDLRRFSRQAWYEYRLTGEWDV